MKTTTREKELAYVWHWKKPLPDGSVRAGHQCRVVARATVDNVVVRFNDGLEVTANRYAIRRAKETA